MEPRHGVLCRLAGLHELLRDEAAAVSAARKGQTMSTTDDGGAAFARAEFYSSSIGTIAGSKGMSLRDYFAGQAAIGILAHHKTLPTGGPGLEHVIPSVARESYRMADAMLAARKVQS